MSREEIPLGSFLWVMEFLYRYAKFVCNRLKLVIFSPICTLKLHGSYRTHYIDNDGVQLIYSIIKEEKQRGATVIVATHHKEDLDELCDTILTVSEGRLIE